MTGLIVDNFAGRMVAALYVQTNGCQRAATPIPFRDLLLSIARTTKPESAAA